MVNKNKILISFTMVLFLVGFASAALDFFDGFEDGTTNNWGEQSCCAHSVEVQSTIKKTGNYAVKFFIDTDDYVGAVNARRAELVLKGGGAGGFLWLSKNTEYWYEADYYFPSDFPTESPRNYVLWQLAPGFGSPSISLRSSEDDISFDGKGTHTNLRLGNIWGTVSSPIGNKHDLGLMTDYLGQWNHIVVHFYLSSESNGYIEVWVNDVKKLNLHNIPTHPSVSTGAYIKCGLYSASSGATPITTYIDNIIYREGSFGCQSKGYQCCDSCQSGAHPEYNADCSGQVCCEICAVPSFLTEQYIEAEDGIINLPMQIGNDPNASGGQYIYVPAGTGNSNTPTAEAVYNINIPYDGDYYIWFLIYGETENNDALYIGFNGNFDREYPRPLQQYVWVKAKTNYTLIKGINEVQISHGEELVRADKIIVTSNPDFVPSASTTCSAADTNSDSGVDILEIMAYITEWKAGNVVITDLMIGIGEWKNGCL